MSCPFPGMDPYLELQPFWSDFAPTLLTAIRNAMVAKLVPRYDVRIEEYLMLTEDDYNLHRVRPDVAISTTPSWQPLNQGSLAIAEPTTIELEYPAYEPRTQRRLKIIRFFRLTHAPAFIDDWPAKGQVRVPLLYSDYLEGAFVAELPCQRRHSLALPLGQRRGTRNSLCNKELLSAHASVG